MDKFHLYKEDNLILTRLLDYSRYIYEEERDRTYNLERKARLIAVFLCGSVLALLAQLPIEKLRELINIQAYVGYIVIIVFFISFVLIVISTVFNILVYRIRIYERLCDPEEFAVKSETTNNENEMLARIIADYVIATNRNHKINESKAKTLSNSIFYLLIGLVLYSISICAVNVNIIIQ